MTSYRASAIVVVRTCPRCAFMTREERTCPRCWTLLDTPQEMLIRTDRPSQAVPQSAPRSTSWRRTRRAQHRGERSCSPGLLHPRERPVVRRRSHAEQVVVWRIAPGY